MLQGPHLPRRRERLPVAPAPQATSRVTRWRRLHSQSCALSRYGESSASSGRLLKHRERCRKAVRSRRRLEHSKGPRLASRRPRHLCHRPEPHARLPRAGADAPKLSRTPIERRVTEAVVCDGGTPPRPDCAPHRRPQATCTRRQSATPHHDVVSPRLNLRATALYNCDHWTLAYNCGLGSYKLAKPLPYPPIGRRGSRAYLGRLTTTTTTAAPRVNASQQESHSTLGCRLHARFSTFAASGIRTCACSYN